MGNKTFAIIKPDAVKAGNTGKIYDRILQAGFNVLSAQLLKMSEVQAKGFYAGPWKHCMYTKKFQND